jgi:hypothetical protein
MADPARNLVALMPDLPGQVGHCTADVRFVAQTQHALPSNSPVTAPPGAEEKEAAMSGSRTVHYSAGRAWLRMGLAALAAFLLFLTMAPQGGQASSHREAPLTAADPQIDATDLYAFVSPENDSKVVFVSNWIPFEEPAGGPNFYAFAEGVNYDINISNDADADPEIIYRWKFSNHYRNPATFLYNTGVVTSLSDTDLNFFQTYDLYRIRVGNEPQLLLNNAKVAPSDVGAASMPSYEDLRDDAVVPVGAKGRSYAGQTNDPFFLDLRVFDLLYGGDLTEVGDDTLKGFNTNTMVLEVPINRVAKDGDAQARPVIGVWTTASRRSTRVQTDSGTQRFTGDWVQVSRLGMPLVNEVVVPVGAKDYFNGSKPRNDEQFLGAVDDPELPHLLNAVYGIPVPDSDPDTAGVQRADLITVFLKGLSGLNRPRHVEPAEMLRLNLTTPPCTPDNACGTYSALGVIDGDVGGFPNGRRLGDDVIDIALQVVGGELIGNPNALGDGVDADEGGVTDTFPYVALPTRGSNTGPHQD